MTTRCCILLLSLLLVSINAEARAKPRLPANVSLAAASTAEAGLDAGLTSPVPGSRISSGFGWRRHPLLRRMRFHGGIDFAAPVGADVLAAGNGIVRSVARARDRGLNILICHSERVCTAYSHLSAVAPGLAAGAPVAAGSVIAQVGRSGRSTGPHLDFEVFVDGLRVDPQPMLAPAIQASYGGAAGPGKRISFID